MFYPYLHHHFGVNIIIIMQGHLTPVQVRRADRGELIVLRGRCYILFCATFETSVQPVRIVIWKQC